MAPQKPTVLVICTITDEMAAQLAAHFDILHLSDLAEPTEQLSKTGDTIPYVLTDGHLGLASHLHADLPNLRAISSYGVGYDAIDTDATCGQGIPVSHTPDVLNEEVATTAIMLYLSCFRNFEAHLANARSGAWERETLPLARSGDNRKVGILGMGRIGEAVARKLQAFGVDIHYHNRNPKDVPYTYHANLLDMAQSVEALISVAPGGEATHHLINDGVMTALGPDGVLVNIGRGSVVDETALISALSEGRLGWAGLDVFENEPNIPAALRALPNVILTPHIGSASVETRRAMGDLAVRNLIAHLETGKMITPVPEAAHL